MAKIREAKAALEAEAHAQAEAKAREVQARLAERERQQAETGKKPPGRPPLVPEPEQAKPAPKAQKNFTDPDSRIMKDGASKSFEQAYNANRLGITYQAVQKLERSSANPTIKTLAKVAKALGRELRFAI